MLLLIEAYHEIDGVRSDLGGFEYSSGVVQKCVKNYKYEGFDSNQNIDEDNQDGEAYITYAYDENAHNILFQIQVTEVDFFIKLKYHSHVYLTLEDNVRKRISRINVELNEVSDNVYIANIKAVTSDSIKIYKGDEL